MLREMTTGLPIGLAPGDGRRVWVFGDTMTLKATASETGGRMSVVEILAAPGGDPAPHVHADEDEALYVLDGEFEIVAGADTTRLLAGGFAFIPRGTPHGFTNVGAEPGRVLVVSTLGER
jgi:quercetin dioxygenase-like cupin family protein